MKKRIGILTSGGDCPGLNAAIRGVVRAAYTLFDVEVIGIRDGFRGLIEGDYQIMTQPQFSNILTRGGTILGSSRMPFRGMRLEVDGGLDRVAEMKKNYHAMKLDCLVVLGGNGTHKTANLLSEEGLSVIGLPKTIDNDIYGTDFTFGFHTAVEIATDVVDRIHTTAASHGRCMVIELMGNKAGWLALYAGVAGGADVILLPEIPYDIDRVADVVTTRANLKKSFSIIAVAEGAMSQAEASMKRREREATRKANAFPGVAARIAAQIQEICGVEARFVVPGHIQRGGTPCAYDRVLSTRFGVHAAQLIRDGMFGVTVALKENSTTHNKLKDVAGVARGIDPGHQMVIAAKNIGISFGA